MKASVEPIFLVLMFVVWIIRTIVTAIGKGLKKTGSPGAPAAPGRPSMIEQQRIAALQYRTVTDRYAGVPPMRSEYTAQPPAATESNNWAQSIAEMEAPAALAPSAPSQVPAAQPARSTRDGLKRALTGSSLLGAIIMAEALAPCRSKHNHAGPSRGTETTE